MQNPNDLPDRVPDLNVPAMTPAPRSRRRLFLVLGLALLVAVGGGFVALVGGVMKSSDAYQDAMARLAADCRATEVLGAPIEAGMLVSGSVETSGASGRADLAIPVEGSAGSGTLHVAAHRAADVWSFELLRLDVDGGAPVDLLSAGSCADGATVAGSPAAAPAKGAAVDAAAPTAELAAPAAKERSMSGPAAAPSAVGGKD